MDFEAFFSRHQKVMLQFSAGKDSAACLHLLRPWWDSIVVTWMNPGDPPEEVLAYMRHIEKIVPHFQEVRGNLVVWLQQEGYPVDVLPGASSGVGRACDDSPARKFSFVYDCCRENAWLPLAREVIRGGYTGVIRGQKGVDYLKSPLHSGSVVDGVEYLFPIEDWSDEEVFDFLGPNVPSSYTRGLTTSLECRRCTAYAKENAQWWAEFEVTEPAAAYDIGQARANLAAQLSDYLAILKGC